MSDALAVPGVKDFREVGESYYLSAIKQTLEAAMGAGIIDWPAVDVVAHILLRALNEAGMSIANAADKAPV